MQQLKQGSHSWMNLNVFAAGLTRHTEMLHLCVLPGRNAGCGDLRSQKPGTLRFTFVSPGTTEVRNRSSKGQISLYSQFSNTMWVNVMKTHPVLCLFRKLDKWNWGRIWTTNPDLRSQSQVSLQGNKWGKKPTRTHYKTQHLVFFSEPYLEICGYMNNIFAHKGQLMML